MGSQVGFDAAVRSTLPCGIQRGPDALQASDAQQQIQPKDEDKNE